MVFLMTIQAKSNLGSLSGIGGVLSATWTSLGMMSGRSKATIETVLGSARETAQLTCGEEGLLEGVWRQGGEVETGRQQGFDLGE